MAIVYIAKDPLCLDKWSRHETDDVRALLVEEFPNEFPETARIYHNEVTQANDITPTNEQEVEALGELEGEFFVIIYPAGGLSILAIVIIAVVAVAAVAFLLQPQIPSVAIRTNQNRQDSSPNNELSQRSNKPRVNGRIPDIFGQVRSTPDLLAVPYKLYENHQEVEFAYMCVGKGTYDVEDIKDGETLVSEIAGTTVEIFAPNTSPNSGDAPQSRIGTAISEEVIKAAEINAVNGQTLRAPNADAVTGSSNIRFEYPDTIAVNSEAGIDFTDFFANNDTLEITNSSFSGSVDPFTQTAVSVKFTYSGTIVFQTGDPSQDYQAGDTLTLVDAARTDGTNPVDLAGSYTISSIDSTTITLSSPAGVNADWDVLDDWASDETGYDDSDVGVSTGSRSGDLNGTYTVLSVASGSIALSSPAGVNADWDVLNELVDDRTDYISPTLETSGDKWIGPFFLDITDLEKVYSNFIGLNGLYKDNGSQQTRFDITVELELTPVDAAGSPTGSAETFQGTIEGSATTRSARAKTIQADPTFTGRCKVRARRVTDADLTFSGSVIDEVKWQQLYGISPIEPTDFGDVTTVHAKTYATSGALSVKNRKLNMLVTRKIPTRISGDTFTITLTATKSVAEIMAFVCLDQYIGNRSPSEVDFDSIYETAAELDAYFGHPEASEFSYTLDNENMSFEETIASMAEAVFCTAYRRGNQVKLSFEKITDDSTIIFNHRTKLPGSETRTIRFGNQDNNDGVELEYVSPVDDVIETYYIPFDRSAVNPRKVETIGVRTEEQAFWHAWRTWNKIQHQNTITEFEATQEAAIPVIRERVLVADNTRPETQDGEVIDQTGLTLTLSQKVVFENGENHIIFLQHVDGTIESIGVVAGTQSNQVVLATAPRASLATDEKLYARCTYIIVSEDNTRPQAFLLAEKSAKNAYVYNITAVNYSHIYYQHDALELWLGFLLEDYSDNSPFSQNGVAQGGAVVGTDLTRGAVHVGAAGVDYVDLPSFTPPTSYTKMAWVKKNDNVSVGHILSSASTTDEGFLIDAGNNLTAGHTGMLNAVTAAYPTDNEWHHVAVCYDVGSTTMCLFVDGELVDISASVGQRTLSDLTAFGFNSGNAMVGSVSDLRLYCKTLTATQIKELYRLSVL